MTSKKEVRNSYLIGYNNYSLLDCNQSYSLITMFRLADVKLKLKLKLNLNSNQKIWAIICFSFLFKKKAERY